MDYDELDKKLNQLMSLDSMKESPEAQSIVNDIKNSIISEKHFSFESESTQSALTISIDGQIIKITDSAAAIFKLELESILNVNLLDLVHPDYKGEILDYFSENNAQNNHPFLNECPILVENDYKWFEIMFIFNDSDCQYRLLVTDINEYKVLESDYQHQSDFISKIIEHIPVGIFCREPNGKFILWSQKCEDMFGYSSEQALRKTPHDVFPEHLANEIIKDDDAVKLAQQNVENSIVLEGNGLPKTIRVIKTPFLENGQPLMYIGICEDITSKLELENKNKQLLIEKEEQRVRKELENIISRSEFMIYNLSLAPEPHVTYISPNVEKITGYSPGQFQQDVNLLLSSTEENTDKYLKNIIKDSCPIRISKEYPYQKADGTTVWLRNDATLEVKDGSRQLIGSCINISETKEMEAEKNTAIDATRVKSEFLAHMSHEIRTPINGVLGLNSLLIKTALNAEQKYYVELIHKSASSLLEIINDILDISKIESGKLELEMREFNLHKFLNETLEIMGVQAKQKDLRFEIELGELPLRVIGDSKHLGQIIRNLVNNALKFTKKGHVSVKAREIDSSHQECTLEFEISDSGIGIPKDKLDSIFNSFTQATDSITRQYGGSGLGLSICKKLIELMKGNITVKSHHHEGTSFIFQISLGLSHSQMVTQIDLPINISMPLQNSLENKITTKILIVEDNDINQLVLSGLLKKFGNNQITCANNGKIGFEEVQKSNFDLIFMDCQMPIMDGFAATRCIRQLDSPKKDIPIIAITANAMTTAKEECMNAGMNEYITKPIHENQLKAIYDKFSSLSASVPKIKTEPPQFEMEFDDSNLRALEDPQLVKQVIDSYDSAIEIEFNKLTGALKNHNLDDSTFIIHSIQGIAGNIGAIGVYKRAKELSSHLKDVGFKSYELEIKSLKDSAVQSQIVLKNYLKNNK